MDYQTMFEKMFDAIRENHSARWGGTMEEIRETELLVRNLRDSFGVELYLKALDKYNEGLRKM